MVDEARNDVGRTVDQEQAVSPKSLYDYTKQAGQWFSVRGPNQSGVTDPNPSAIHDPNHEVHSAVDPDYADDFDIVPLAHVMEPIPVVIANPNRPPTPRKMRIMNAPSVAPNIASGLAVPTQILGLDETRLKAIIKVNTGGAGVYLGTDQSFRAVDGYFIDSTSIPFVTESTNAIWAIGAHASNYERLSIAVEYTDGEA